MNYSRYVIILFREKKIISYKTIDYVINLLLRLFIVVIKENAIW